jgi:hypothetical protein
MSLPEEQEEKIKLAVHRVQATLKLEDIKPSCEGHQ